jgi:hypothetical protein
MPGIDTETQDAELQWLGASMWMWCPPTTNENELPACADELTTISAARYQNRFIAMFSGMSCETSCRRQFRM